MRIDPTIAVDSRFTRTEPVSRAGGASVPTVPERSEAAVAAADPNLPLRRLIGDVDIRRLSPRQMIDTSLDLYVAGILPWEEYAMLAFQAELHPDYDGTIGALTGEPAQPDRPRDFLGLWEERLGFEEKYNAHRSRLVARTRHIVQVFRQLGAPTNLLA